MRCHRHFSPPTWMLTVAAIVCPVPLFAQSSSYGPGKGPAVGHGYGKATFPASRSATRGVTADPGPGDIIPANAAKRRWKVTSEFNGQKTDAAPIPVYFFGDRDLRFVGTVPKDTEIKLEFTRTVNHVIYYGIPWDKDGPAPKEKAATARLAWVQGSFIQPID